MESIEEKLSGGHPNSLGRTVEVVDEVLASPELFSELFNCYFSTDELVRLRTSNAIKRICIANKSLVLPYADRLLSEISAIDQASTQWTLALLFGMLKEDLTSDQIEKAKVHLKENLEHHNDWIVLNNTMETLANWSAHDEELKVWLIPHLERLTSDPRKSVAGRAKKMLRKVS